VTWVPGAYDMPWDKGVLPDLCPNRGVNRLMPHPAYSLHGAYIKERRDSYCVLVRKRYGKMTN